MKPIQVKNNHDCTVSVQVIKTEITDHAGTRKGPDEICLLIENEKGDHVALFTPGQASELIKAIEAARMQVAAGNSVKTC